VLDEGGEGEAAPGRLRVVLPEVVDELLRAYGRGVGQPAVVEGALRVAERGGVDVEGEGREVAGGRAVEGPSTNLR
jgi:hypothetical protein